MRSRRDSPIIECPTVPDFAGFSLVRDVDINSHGGRSEEIALLNPRAVDARKRAFRRGRQAGHEALLKIGLDSGPILREDRMPIWPAGSVGAISHSGSVSVALVAPAENTDGVGVDIERFRFRSVPELARYVPVPEESARLEALNANDQAWSLLQLFSAKEAIFKAFYPRVRQFFGFDAAALRPHDSGFTARLIQPIDPDYPREREFLVQSARGDDVVMSWLVLPKK